jgi:hypothetical protein
MYNSIDFMLVFYILYKTLGAVPDILYLWKV